MLLRSLALLALVAVGTPALAADPASIDVTAKLVNNPAYPEAVAAYQASFATWKALPCDVFLGSHGNFFDLEKKWKRRERGEANPFVDPAGYQRAIVEAEKKFLAAVENER